MFVSHRRLYMYNLSRKYFWDADPETNEIILTKDRDYSSTDVVLNNLPEEMHIKPEDLISFDITDMPHPGRGVATTVGTAAIGTVLLGPLGLLMGAGAGAMTANKENQKDKKVSFQFRRDNDNNQYEYEGTIPSKLLWLLDGIVDSPDFGKNASLGGTAMQAVSGVSSANVNINPNDPTPTIERIKLFLEDEDWSSATRYCNAALDLFPTYSNFYILKYCAKNNIKYVDNLNNEAPEKLHGDDDFQKALRFSSDSPDDAKAIYENSLQRAFNDIARKESKSLSSQDFTKMQQEMEAIKYYKPAQEKAEEYRLCAASALISEKNSEYLRTKGLTNSSDHQSMIGAIQKYEQQLSVVRSNRTSIKEYVKAGKGSSNDLMLEDTIETTMKDTRKQLYELACVYIDENTIESLENAKESFAFLGNYSDSENKLTETDQRLKDNNKAVDLETLYDKASVAENVKNYDEAINIYQSLGDYKDSQQKIKEVETAKKENEYDKAVRNFNSGNNHKAKEAFASLGDYKDSKEYLDKAENAAKKRTKKIVAIVAVIAIVIAGAGVGIHKYQVKKAEEAARIAKEKRLKYEKKSEEMKPTIEEALSNSCTGLAAGASYTVGLKKDGTVIFTTISDEEHDEGETAVEDWEDIIAVSAGYNFTVGLKKDGTVICTNAFRQSYVEDWEDIIAVSSGSGVVGLKKDGTVVTEYEDEELAKFKDIVAVSVGGNCIVCLKKDGTIACAPFDTQVGVDEQKELKDWKDIIAISAGENHTIGLKKDGTVVSTRVKGLDHDEQTKVEGWKDIIAISAGPYHTVGLKKDGTVVSTEITDGRYDYGQTKVEGWKDIVAVSAGDIHTVGLRKDGTVVSTAITDEYHDCGQTEVEGWKDIINMGYKYLSR